MIFRSGKSQIAVSVLMAGVALWVMPIGRAQASECQTTVASATTGPTDLPTSGTPMPSGGNCTMGEYWTEGAASVPDPGATPGVFNDNKLGAVVVTDGDTVNLVSDAGTYFDPGRGSAPAAERSAARHMGDADLDRWAKTAATHAAPGGEVVFVYPAAALGRLLAAFETRFGAITVLPLLPREGEPASRLLIRAIKGSRAPLTLLASRALHESTGRAFKPAFEAICRGATRLEW